MADCTQLWYDGRLMNEITSSSKFKSMPKVPLSTEEQRTKAAENLMQGWIENADYDPSKFEIRQAKTKPMVLSKMTSDIIARSREGIGQW